MRSQFIFTNPDGSLRAFTSLANLPLMLTVTEAAIVLRISRTSAYKLADEFRRTGGVSGLPVIELGGRLIVRRVDLAAIIESSAA
jgi:hypothetical protein